MRVRDGALASQRVGRGVAGVAGQGERGSTPVTAWDFRGLEHKVAFDVLRFLEDIARDRGPRRFLANRRWRFDLPLESYPRLRIRLYGSRRLPLRAVLRTLAGRLGLRCNGRDSARWETLGDFVRWAASRLEPVEIEFDPGELCWCGSGKELGKCCSVGYKPRQEHAVPNWLEVYRQARVPWLEEIEEIA